MPSKKVIVFLNHPPIGDLRYAEGIRASLGLGSGIDEHEITLVCLGKGAYLALKDIEKKDFFKYIDALLNVLEIPGKLFVEEESLKELGIAKDEIALEWEIVKREKIAQIIGETDVTVCF